MPKLPDWTNVSAPPIRESGRPVASYGTDAIGAGVRSLGAGLGRLSNSVIDIQARAKKEDSKYDDRIATAKADAHRIKREADFEEYMAANPDLSEQHEYNYRLHSKAVLEEASPLLPKDDRLRQLWMLRQNNITERQASQIRGQTVARERDSMLARDVEELNNLKRVPLTATPEQRAERIATAKGLIGSMVDAGLIKDTQAVNTFEAWRNGYVTRYFQTLSPRQAVEELGVATPGSFRRSLKGSESSRDPSRVNQFGFAGLYQFGAPRLKTLGLYKPSSFESMTGWSKSGRNARGKWSGTFNIPGFPDVKTMSDFLANPAAQEKAGDIHFSEIDSQIKQRGLDKYIGQTVDGVKITREGIHGMAHLGGIAGAERFLSGKGNARDANKTSLRDYAKKFGSTKANPMAAYLSPRQRQIIVGNANRQIRNEVKPIVDMVLNSQSAALNAGVPYAGPPVTQEQVNIAHGGGIAAASKWQQYVNNEAVSKQIETAGNKSNAELDVLAKAGEGLKSSGGINQAANIKLGEVINTAVTRIKTARESDFGGQAIRMHPQVRELHQGFIAAVATNDPEQIRSASSALYSGLQAARREWGVTSTNLLPKAMVEKRTAEIKDALAKGGYKSLAKEIVLSKQIWGENFYQVWNELARTSDIPKGALVAATIPMDDPANEKIINDIVEASVNAAAYRKGRDKTEEGTIKTAVETKFREFSLTLGKDSRVARNAYKEAITALAFKYSDKEVGKQQGGSMDPTSAVNAAFGAVIGNHYHYVGQGMRIPKSTPYVANEEEGASLVRGLNKLITKDELDNLRHSIVIGSDKPGLTKDFTWAEYRDSIAKNGKWFTLDDNSGFVMKTLSNGLYKPVMMYGADNTPVPFVISAKDSEYAPMFNMPKVATKTELLSPRAAGEAARQSGQPWLEKTLRDKREKALKNTPAQGVE